MLVELDNVHKIGFFTCIEYKAQKKYLYKFQNLIELAQPVNLITIMIFYKFAHVIN